MFVMRRCTSLLLLLVLVTASITTAAVVAFEMPFSKQNLARRSIIGGSGGGSLSERSVLDSLERMTSFFRSMVDQRTDRFYYRCLPAAQKRIHEHCPIRDMGSAWDATTLLLFWKDKEAAADRLGAAVRRTIEAYSSSFETSRRYIDGIFLDRNVLLEPPNIAHSAFLILASTGALRLSLLSGEQQQQQVPAPPPIDKLAKGIVSMQQKNGAFNIHFDAEKDERDIYRGIEFYPGEACLALMDVWELTNDSGDGESNTPHSSLLETETRESILPAVMRAFSFYSDYYYNGNVGTHYTSFFANWQVQCFVRLLDALRGRQDSKSVEMVPAVAEYILDLCNDVVSSEPWQSLMIRDGSGFRHLSTVEMACGLEALADGTRVALELSRENLAAQYWRYVVQAVQFLQAVQDQVPKESVGYGGLGHALGYTEQRLDVTGHAVNALTKICKVNRELGGNLAGMSTRAEL